MKLKAESIYSHGDTVLIMRNNRLTRARIFQIQVFFKAKKKSTLYYTVQLGTGTFGLVGATVLDYVMERDIYSTVDEALEALGNDIVKDVTAKGTTSL